eukprot:TRINITY_DN32790_c0_g1_i1.p1 TRINITY_DN32790_c0_g1~~TRINITY_DN32790_c0_g1_i1.p1  ORF type:complete len:1043 (-),score=328.39 TRINITY_DN32790_c0_g1_i1:159-3182(-)
MGRPAGGETTDAEAAGGSHVSILQLTATASPLRSKAGFGRLRPHRSFFEACEDAVEDGSPAAFTDLTSAVTEEVHRLLRSMLVGKATTVVFGKEQEEKEEAQAQGALAAILKHLGAYVDVAVHQAKTEGLDCDDDGCFRQASLSPRGVHRSRRASKAAGQTKAALELQREAMRKELEQKSAALEELRKELAAKEEKAKKLSGAVNAMRVQCAKEYASQRDRFRSTLRLHIPDLCESVMQKAMATFQSVHFLQVSGAIDEDAHTQLAVQHKAEALTATFKAERDTLLRTIDEQKYRQKYLQKRLVTQQALLQKAGISEEELQKQLRTLDFDHDPDWRLMEEVSEHMHHHKQVTEMMKTQRRASDFACELHEVLLQQEAWIDDWREVAALEAGKSSRVYAAQTEHCNELFDLLRAAQKGERVLDGVAIAKLLEVATNLERFLLKEQALFANFDRMPASEAISSLKNYMLVELEKCTKIKKTLKDEELEDDELLTSSVADLSRTFISQQQQHASDALSPPTSPRLGHGDHCHTCKILRGRVERLQRVIQERERALREITAARSCPKCKAPPTSRRRNTSKKTMLLRAGEMQDAEVQTCDEALDKPEDGAEGVRGAAAAKASPGRKGSKASPGAKAAQRRPLREGDAEVKHLRQRLEKAKAEIQKFQEDESICKCPEKLLTFETPFARKTSQLTATPESSTTLRLEASMESLLSCSSMTGRGSQRNFSASGTDGSLHLSGSVDSMLRSLLSPSAADAERLSKRLFDSDDEGGALNLSIEGSGLGGGLGDSLSAASIGELIDETSDKESFVSKLLEKEGVEGGVAPGSPQLPLSVMHNTARPLRRKRIWLRAPLPTTIYAPPSWKETPESSQNACGEQSHGTLPPAAATAASGVAADSTPPRGSAIAVISSADGSSTFGRLPSGSLSARSRQNSLVALVNSPRSGHAASLSARRPSAASITEAGLPQLVARPRAQSIGSGAAMGSSQSDFHRTAPLAPRGGGFGHARLSACS